jgi:hypothetical protein
VLAASDLKDFVVGLVAVEVELFVGRVETVEEEVVAQQMIDFD